MSDIDVRVPDIGDFKDVPVIEVLVKPGDRINKEDPLITLESEKATMEVPAPVSGVVKDLKVNINDKVSQGSSIMTVTVGDAASPAETQADEERADDRRPQANVEEGAEVMEGPGSPPPSAPPSAETRQPQPAAPQTQQFTPPPPSPNGEAEHDGDVHASPSIRRFARELGVDLHSIRGSGPSGRITREDVQGFVKSTLSEGAKSERAPAIGGAFGVAPWPQVDFAQFGPTERQPLSRIKKIAGPSLHRNWVMIPHVTNNEDADVTELEEFRKRVNAEAPGGVKLTMLAFLIKAAVSALQKYPEFNASLDADALILKRYYNIGFAADTPHGLVVPVIRNADQKGVVQIAGETAALAAKARDGKLGPNDMSGGTFTISSLGGIGGTYFTPIINAPEVAILGACRAALRPLWNGSQFVPRLILPLSLSYDHRVIDGAAAARFNVYLAALLADMRLATL
ncbi:MAG: dihydrolipoyllysine-residue acetyltransferase [Candidatus Eremiobacteraeota bacterium]|nr:dihydrolipoyllysine-residue acetyltransferase [Candidatus Eremiobacteraeota bacterium]